MRFPSAVLLMLSLLLWQCNESNSSMDNAAASPDATTETPAPAAATPEETFSTPYPSITQEAMMNLYENCDYIDFVFYSTNFSMSQKEIPAIRNTLAGVSTQPAQVSNICQPVGRVFFQIDGENAEEADLFFGGNCLYYLFLKDGTYTYGNQLTKPGYEFYQNIFRQAAAAGGQ